MTNEIKRKVLRRIITLLRELDNMIEIEERIEKYPDSQEAWKLKVRLGIILKDFEKALKDDGGARELQ